MASDLTEFPITTKKVSELSSGTTLDGTETLNAIQSTFSKKITVDQIQTKILTDKLVTVADTSDLPTGVSGVITLSEDTTYLFTTSVDLVGERLVAQSDTSIVGLSTESCKISSTGLTGSALITSNYSLALRFITLEAETPFALDASSNANQSLNWLSVNLVSCTNQGTIKSYENFIGDTIGVLDSAGFSFDGTMDTIAFSESLFNTSSSKKAISLLSTLTLNRRFRAIYSAFVIESGETGIEVVSGATVPDEGILLVYCNFSGGGTYLSGITSSDDEARLMENRGINNSLSSGQLYMNNNATATTIAVSGTYYKVTGTTSAGSFNERFTHTSGRLTYTGALTSKFKVSVPMSLTGTNNKVLRFRLAKNGTTIASTQMSRTINASGAYANMALQDIIELETDDYIEVFCTNSTDTNSITVSDMNMIAIEA